MKPITYSLLAAAFACGMAQGAATAYTVPVGYVTVTVPGNSDTTIVPPIERPTSYAGASTGISGNVISASGLTSGAFVTTPSYLQVTSGSLSGQRFPITANDTTSITVSASPDLQTAGFASGNTFKVIPYWTLNTLFPSGAGVGTTSDALNPSSFVLASGSGVGVNQASSKLYFYCTGDVDNSLPAGWYDNDDVFAGPLTEALSVISPTKMYSIRTSSVTDQSVVISGSVPSAGLTVPVAVDTQSNDVYLGSCFPIDVSLADSGLQSAVQATSDALNPTEFVFVFDDLSVGLNKAASKLYFYCSGDVDNSLPAGWYDNDDVFAGPVANTNKVIKAGRALVIRKAPYMSAGYVSWAAPLPYTL